MEVINYREMTLTTETLSVLAENLQLIATSYFNSLYTLQIVIYSGKQCNSQIGYDFDSSI